jgi:hypothetical protein
LSFLTWAPLVCTRLKVLCCAETLNLMALPGPSHHVASASTPFNLQQADSFLEVDLFDSWLDRFFNDETTDNNSPDANGSDQERGSGVDNQDEWMEPGEEQEETFMNDMDRVMNNMQQLVIDRAVPPLPPVCVVV